MIRKIFPTLLVAAFLTACGNTGSKENSTKADGESGNNQIEFASLIENPGSYVGKTISVEGKVVHVCTHSGKKLFITGENPDVRLYIQAGENMPKFPMELLGSEIVVEGTLTNATASAMGEGEGMQAMEATSMQVSTDTCETAKAMAAQPVLADLMMVYNKHEVIK
jgi:hypothetical protein